MKKFELADLKEGDIVQHVSGGKRYIVTGNYGGRVTAVLTVDITNHSEWELVFKVIREELL